jgi:hypothetical protein
MFTLKPIDPAAIPKALEKAERYRLLNEPEEAESICLDVLAIDPDDQRALTTLLLALTDQFRAREGDRFAHALSVLPKIAGEYERCYYAGLIRERRGSAHLEHGGPGSGEDAYDWLVEAMGWYEKAEGLRPPNNDDAILRWNTCARIIQKHDLKPRSEAAEPLLLE